MKSLLTWTERRLPRLFRKLSNRQCFHLKAEMFSFHSKYFVFRDLKRAPQKLSFCLKCPDTGTVRILFNILYSLLLEVIFTIYLTRNRQSSWTSNKRENVYFPDSMHCARFTIARETRNEYCETPVRETQSRDWVLNETNMATYEHVCSKLDLK